MTSRVVVLVEPGAHRPGGHRHRALVALAQAHGRAVVVTPYGAVGETAASLCAAGARVVRPAGGGAVLLAAGAWAEAASAAGRRVLRRCPVWARRVPHQVMLVARCLVEVACVRAGRRAGGPHAVVVVLSASEALHGVAGWLGGPHVRFVHEVVTIEDAPLRLAGRLARHGAGRVVALAPTEAVRAELAARFPGLPVQTRPFAVAEPGDRISEEERRQARAAFGIPAGETAVCLVGGWWPYKDVDVVHFALHGLQVPLHLVVAGAPLDHRRLSRWSALRHVRVHVVPAPFTEQERRAVYAAADAAVVARRPGVGKESGLVTDAVQLGVPLLLSDHDPALTARLAVQDWVRLFPAGDPAGLAAALTDLAGARLPRPAVSAASLLGVPTAEEQAAFLARIDLQEMT